MATPLSALLNDPGFDSQTPDGLRTMTQATGIQAPDREDVHAALQHGPQAIRLLLASPKLPAHMRQHLASEGLLDWSKNVLNFRQSVDIAQAFVAAGADVNVATPSGRTPVTAFAEQLGRMDAEENSPKTPGARPVETGAARVLRSAWALLEAQGARMEKAKDLRESARLLRQNTMQVSSWRSGRSVAAPAPTLPASSLRSPSLR